MRVAPEFGRSCLRPSLCAQAIRRNESATTPAEANAANGTSISTILWYYLRYERNATYVAKQLHMHRNTVLYHIEKIQSRFDFDLSRKTVREWLLVCYKSLFLLEHKEAPSPAEG